MYNLATDEDTITDLKQFITITVSQQATGLREDIVNDIRGDIKTVIKKLDVKLSKKIDDLSGAVAEAIDASNEATDSQLKGHEQRIGKLEQKVA